MGGNGTRRTAALLVCGSLALVAAAPVGAHEVSTSRATYLVAEGAWGTFDAETMAGDQSIVTVVQMGAGAWDLAYERVTLDAVTCTMGTKTTADDEPGVAGTIAEGEGQPDTIRVDARRLRWAEAAGTVDVTVYAIDTCEGTFDPVDAYQVDVALDLHAAGRLRHTHDRSRWVEPGVFREQAMTQLTERTAAGTATVGTHTYPVTSDLGIVGRVRSIDHYLEH